MFSSMALILVTIKIFYVGVIKLRKLLEITIADIPANA
jgi:hypothetical protein